jgi:hypothetical protein
MSSNLKLPLPRRVLPIFCFLTRTPLKVSEHLHALEVAVEEGPVRCTGAGGPIESVYLRDPNENLIEISSYLYYLES